jgi:hypothetical protein
MSWLSYSPDHNGKYGGQIRSVTEVLTSLNDVGEGLDTFGGACLTVVFTRCLPGINEVDVALGEPCDFDQPVRLTGADNRAELVDVALRYAWIDARIASGASKRISVDRLGDRNSTSVEGHWDSGGERQEEMQKDAEHGEEHCGGLNGALWEVV